MQPNTNNNARRPDDRAADSLTSDGWAPCPAGELQGLASRLQAAERRRRTLSVAGVAGGTTAATAAVVLALGLLVGGDNTPVLGGISCTKCVASFEVYREHLTEGDPLDEAFAEQMATHIRKCPWCRKKFETTYPGLLGANGIADLTPSQAFVLAASYWSAQPALPVERQATLL